MILPFDASAMAPELWIRVIALLEPPAIISLSKTCKHLHGLVTDRSVWVREIRTMCLERGLFSPSYPVDDMDIAHLQRAAMGPYLCEDLFQTHSVSLNDDIEPKSVEPASEMTLDIGASRVMKHHLVPGGRFLITASTGNLSAWDLGVPGHVPLAPPVVISSLTLDFPEEEGDLINLSVSVVGDRSLRIAVMLWSYTTLVYEICLDDEKPALRLLPGTISPGNLQQPRSAELNGNRVFLSRIDKTLIIWDCIAKRYTLWTIDMAVEDWYACRIKFFGDLLVVISSNNLRVWLVPTPDRPCNALITHASLGPNDPAPCPPDVTINFPVVDGVAGRRGVFNCPSNWYPRSGDPLTFDVLYVPPGGQPMLGPSTRYQLTVTFHDDAGPTPISADLQLIATFDFMGRYMCERYHHSFSRYISGYPVPITVVKDPLGPMHAPRADSGRTRDYDVYSVSPTPLESYNYPVGDPYSTQDRPPRAIVRLTRLHSVGNPNLTCKWSLCASSGRLVYLGYLDNSRATNMVFIRSYLD